MTYKIQNFFYFANYSCKHQDAIRPSVLSFYHLTFVLSGKVTYKANDKEIVLCENDALLLPSGTKRERLKSDSPAHYVIFNYLPTKGNELSSPLLMKNSVNATVRNLLTAYPYKYYRVYNPLSVSKPENARINEILPNIFNCILTELFASLKYKTDNVHVQNIIKYVNDNVTSPLSLSIISNALHLSREYTSRIFKKELGITLTEYINEQKMLFAKDMLSSSVIALNDIAGWLGYENYGYFSKVFKNYFGLSPAKMKANLNNN